MPSLGRNDNVFELGGDSSLALQLLNEIGAVCGRETATGHNIPSPYNRQLGRQDGQRRAPVPRLVLLKAGTEARRFYCPWSGGSAIDFFNPPSGPRTNHPILGCQAEASIGGTNLERTKIWPVHTRLR